MPRPRLKPCHPYMQGLINAKGFDTAKEAAIGLGITKHYGALLNYTNCDGSNRHLEALVSIANAFGVSTDQLIAGILSERPLVEEREAG